MKLFILLVMLITTPVMANDYNRARDQIFWPKLYAGYYETLYCGAPRGAGDRVTVEHVYPASWIASASGCKNRRTCKTETYKKASSDLHNLYPALAPYNQSRGNLPFGDIVGNIPHFNLPCDFERSTTTVEPRDQVKGDIARSMLYMIHQYKLPDHDLLSLLVRWNAEDPPNNIERARNQEIERLQGNLNPFID